jgi:Domain of unknown function (DUF4177)
VQLNLLYQINYQTNFEGVKMTKYEYATVPLLTHATKQILDTWGSDGWELVQVVPAPGGGDQLVAYMKRAIS